VRERKRGLEQDLARLRSQERTLLGEVERLGLEERLRAAQLRESELLLERTNAELDATLKRERELARSVEAARPVLAARARALYKLGELSYVRILLSVDQPSDFFRGYRFVTTLARRDNERLAAFRADLSALAAARVELEARTRRALALRSELSRQRASLIADRKRKTGLLAEITDKRETHAAYLRELTEAEVRLGQLLAGLGEGHVAVPIAAFRGQLPWPVAGRIRVPYGPRKHPRFETYTAHNGLDFETAPEAPVAAVHEGSVAFAGRFQGYGPMVVVDHGGKHHSLYAHLAEIGVRVGQRVAAGEPLGTAGEGLEGPGIYFEMRFQGRAEDPADWLKARGN
jgi:septal ring factor EnvC (AmiA/AmiB activator)